MLVEKRGKLLNFQKVSPISIRMGPSVPPKCQLSNFDLKEQNPSNPVNFFLNLSDKFR